MVVDRRSFLRAILLVFLVWVVAITTSTHVIVALYFAASAVLWWWVGIRIHFAGFGFERQVIPSIPRPRHVVVAAMLALLVSIPIFLALPRIRSPWISGRGGVSSVTGFSSHVDLAGVGTIRQSRQVAMIVRSVSGEAIRVGVDSPSRYGLAKGDPQLVGASRGHSCNPTLPEALFGCTGRPDA